MIKSYAQVNQDLFVYKLLGDNNFFLDIGAGWDHSGVNSNTLLLEEKGWKGICIEGDENSFQNRLSKSINSKVIKAFIPNKHIIDILNENNSPKLIDYVSIDIDPTSLVALKDFPFDEYEARIITFEHDLYRLGPSQKEEAFGILNKKGYIRLCEDVLAPLQYGPMSYFEDWYINIKYFTQEFILKNQMNKKSSEYILENILL